MSQCLNDQLPVIKSKWGDKSTKSNAMIDFESDIVNQVIERHMLQIQDILLQYLNFN